MAHAIRNIPIPIRRRLRCSRRGGIYVAVLSAAMIVALIGIAGMAAVRVQRLSVIARFDEVKARLYADSAVELGLAMIKADPSWRTNHTSGVWINHQALDDGAFTLEVIDPLDGDLANRPYDQAIVKGTGYRGGAVQMVQLTIAATGVPIDALKMAVHTAGDLHIGSGATLKSGGAPASTNTTLSNQGTVNGNVECTLAILPGTVTGTLTLAAPNKPMPDSGVQAMYMALGTAISPPSATIDHVVLSPASNPWSAGATNADGVYVLNTSSNVLIRNCRIVGTLVIVAPGRTITIDQNVLIQPFRSDYPTLIVQGDLQLQYASSTLLSEGTLGVNFNPPGTPYLGLSDVDTADTYPSEIQGLVHVKGVLQMINTATVRGVVICESAAASKAVDVSNTPDVEYNAGLFSAPPMGYTKSVTMSIVPGSWKQVVNP